MLGDDKYSSLIRGKQVEKPNVNKKIYKNYKDDLYHPLSNLKKADIDLLEMRRDIQNIMHIEDNGEDEMQLIEQ